MNKLTEQRKLDIVKLYDKLWKIPNRLDTINQELDLNLTLDRLRRIVSDTKKKIWQTQSLPDVPEEIQKDLKEIIEEDLSNKKDKQEHREVKGKYEELLLRFWDLSDKLDTIAWVKEVKPRFLSINPALSRWWEATAVWVASDWHIDEIVDPKTINYYNEFNSWIAEARAKNFFKNWLRLTDIMSKDIKVEHILLAVLWDMISWFIHPELIENNSESPTQALIRFRDILVSWIKYILDNSNYKLTLICKFGNHWRTTDKIRVSTWYKNSYEWLIYHLIANEFKDNERVNFIIEDWYHTYFKVYDYNLRFHHWDSIKFWWWVWWITIPINKAVAQWNKWPKKADIDVLWHFHQSLFHRNFVVNWSLIWYNAYAERIKADYEEPSQSFFLIDKKKWKTIQTCIFLD